MSSRVWLVEAHECAVLQVSTIDLDMKLLASQIKQCTVHQCTIYDERGREDEGDRIYYEGG